MSNPDSIVITGIGMVSSLGLDVANSCAAARAGVSRTEDLDYCELWDTELQDSYFSLGHKVPSLAEGFEGFGKLIRLGTLALNDLFSHLKYNKFDFKRTGLIVNLASDFYSLQAIEKEKTKGSSIEEIEDELIGIHELSRREQEYKTRLVPMLMKYLEIESLPAYHTVCFKDHSGIAEAIQDAVRLISRKELDRCIIGGIDSWLESDQLDVLNRLELIKSPSNPEGFVPGEAASFFVIESLRTAQSQSMEILAELGPTVITHELVHRFSDMPSTGVALSEAIAQLHDLDENKIDPSVMIGTLNGDRWQACEWGNAQVRVCSHHFLNGIEEWYPAVSFGETGAATGAIAISMVAREYSRESIKGSKALVWLSSYDGSKAAFFLKKYST